MARFRQYKNGIFGHRYKDLYVIRTGDSIKDYRYSIIDEDRNLIKSNMMSYWDAEWEIDKLQTPPQEMQVVRKLYAEDIPTLNRFFVQLTERKHEEALSIEENELLDWIVKIRRRKTAGYEY